VGEALEELYTPRPIAPTNLPVPIDDAHLAELAHHFCAAALGDDFEKAVDYALRAGDHAAALSAGEDAVQHYKRALAVLDAADPGGDPRGARSRILRGLERVGEKSVSPR
jgi:hypothetical protein